MQKKNGGQSGGTIRRDFELINCPTSTKNLPKKLVKPSTQTVPLQATVEIQLKRPRDHRFCWNNWKEDK